MKKKKHSPASAVSVAAPSPLLSPRGKKVLIAGLSLAVLGFITLTYTDPAGQNWASILSPFLLVSGYSCVGISLTLKKTQ